jgi:hypothetical protein
MAPPAMNNITGLLLMRIARRASSLSGPPTDTYGTQGMEHNGQIRDHIPSITPLKAGWVNIVTTWAGMLEFQSIIVHQYNLGMNTEFLTI